LRSICALFVYITKHGAYIDGFAGPQEPERPEMWTAKLVLELQPKRLGQFFLCELNRKSYRALDALIASLRSDPKRKISSYYMDFNKAVHEILASGNINARFNAIGPLSRR
jgi:hypothetical protein